MNITLFMTRGLSLTDWRDIGTLDREFALYKTLRDKHDAKVNFVTWGGKDDRLIARQHGFAGACPNTRQLSEKRYHKWLPLLHWRTLWQADIIKTNQMRGAEVAMRAARFWRMPFISRQGFLRSEFAERNFGFDSAAAQKEREQESRVFDFADAIIITTDKGRNDIIEKYKINPEKIFVVPNYVDTSVFAPASESRSSGRRVVYIGRLEDSQKNLSALLDAAEGLTLDELLLVGEGELRSNIERRKSTQPWIKMAGSVANYELPELLRSSDIFALPSFFEGHPKSLIEAMACGLPVVASNVSGIREFITHGETGWLVEPDAQSLREGIEHLLANPDLSAEIGCNARRYAIENYALEHVAEMEWNVCQTVLSQKGKK